MEEEKEEEEMRKMKEGDGGIDEGRYKKKYEGREEGRRGDREEVG